MLRGFRWSSRRFAGGWRLVGEFRLGLLHVAPGVRIGTGLRWIGNGLRPAAGGYRETLVRLARKEAPVGRGRLASILRRFLALTARVDADRLRRLEESREGPHHGQDRPRDFAARGDPFAVLLGGVARPADLLFPPEVFPSGSRKAPAAAVIRVPTFRTPLPILAPARTTGSAFLAASWTHFAPGRVFFLMNTPASYSLERKRGIQPRALLSRGRGFFSQARMAS